VTRSFIIDILTTSERLLGRSADDSELQSFLNTLNMWPLSPFGTDEFRIYAEDKDRGICLLFKDSATIKHQVAANKIPGTPIFSSIFFYADGVEGYHAYSGQLPLGINWIDTVSRLVSRLGAPQHEIRNNKTGQLRAQKWPLGHLSVTVVYVAGGSSIERVDLGLY